MPATAADEQLLPYALCTYKDVQIAMAGATNTGTSPQQITRLINLFSEMVQGGSFMNRQLEIKVRTEYFDIMDCSAGYFPAGERSNRIQLAAPPIVVGAGDPPVPMIALYNSQDRTYATAGVLYDDFDVNVERGIISSRSAWFNGGPRALKVMYTGGLVFPGDTDALPAPLEPVAPDDLRNACAMQVTAWFSRRKEFGLDSIGFPGGGAISLSDPTKLLAQVNAVIRKYKVIRGCF